MENKMITMEEAIHQTDMNIMKLLGGLTEYQKRQQEIMEELNDTRT